jgi:phosphatidylglycerol:prolipoprotein diacylglycerol transferase
MAINYTPIKVLFSIGNINVPSHGFMLAMGFLFFIIGFLFLIKKKRLNFDVALAGVLIGIIGGIIGARVTYVFYKGNFLDLASYFTPKLEGTVFYGGFIFSVILVYLYLRFKKENPLNYFDALGISIFLLLAIGRIGCFLNWCCYGIQSSLPWAIKVGTDIARHPTQIYSSLFNFTAFFAFLKMSKKQRPSGYFFALFLIVYGIFRFFIEFIRIEPKIIWIFSLSQIVSIFVVSFGILILKRKIRI